jgi:hypothetical protein
MAMIDELRYQIQTRRYFEPQKQNYVDKNNLVKILKGEVRNPHKMRRPNSTTDYGYFIICNIELDNLHEEKERKFDSGMIDELFYKSQWFGQFEVESESSIIIPNEVEIDISPKRNLAIASERKGSVWSGGGFYQCDKNWGERILTSDVSLNEMLELVKEVYNLNDISNCLK